MYIYFKHKLLSWRGLPHRLFLVGLALFVGSGNLLAADLKFAWDAPATGSIPAGYKVFYGTSSGNYGSSVDVGNATTTTVSGLTAGSTYYFAVNSYDAAGNQSAFSNEINATIPVTPELTADFTESATSGVASFAVLFTPVTTGTITTWTWDFPGSYTPSVTNSTAQPVNVTYPTAGSYSVSLTVTGPSGSVTKTYPSLITVTNTTTTTTTTATATATATLPPVSETSKIGLVAAYGFEEISGNAVADASGQGNHGTIKEAVSITTGKYGKALNFDGVNDWVTVNNSASLSLSTGMSLEAWVYPQSLDGWNTVILKETSSDQDYGLYASDDANLPRAAFYANGSYYPVSDLKQLPLNQWTHLVETYDGQYQRLYVNGIEVGKSMQKGLIQQSSGVLRIGGNSVWGEYFQGFIDEVRIYNRALTAEEVMYNKATAISVSNPPKFVMGDQTQEPWVDYRAQGIAEAFQTVPEKSSAVTTVLVYLDSSSTATELVAGIYKDYNGHPGALVAQGKLISTNTGTWNPVSIPVATVTAGQPYWIAILGSKGQIGFRDRVGSGTGLMETSVSSGLTSLPLRWSGQLYKTNSAMSIYGDGY